MEGLPYDFGIEDPDAKAVDKRTKNKTSTAAETVKEKPEPAEVETEKSSKENLSDFFEGREEDTAPELDAEAPLDHLSRVESEAIAQTMASERLVEIQEDDQQEVSSESLAAESFLENVEASGDIDLAYKQTLMELGEAVMNERTEDAIVESETVAPVDPESLVEAAKNELAPNVTYKIKNVSENHPASRPAPEKPHSSHTKKSAEVRSERLYEGIVDYVVGRRFARVAAAEKRHDEVERKLSNEVSNLRNVLSSRETNVRQLAQNRAFEKPAKLKVSKAENIGKVLVDLETPEHPTISHAHKIELAGISAHTMKHSELIRAAEGINVEGNTLRSIYDMHLVGEKGLRRVVAEFLRGGNYKSTLKHELLEREKDFERDPKLRDQASSLPISSSNAELDNLLHRSGIDWSEPQTLFKQPKISSTNLTAFVDDMKTSGKSLRRIADIAMITAIAGMAAVITILIFIK